MDAQLVVDLFRLSRGRAGFIDVEALYALHPASEEVYQALYALGEAGLVTVSWDEANIAKIIYVHAKGLCFAEKYSLWDIS